MNSTEETEQTVAVYAGTFDPVTNGHVDVINRALNMFDKVIIAVAVNPQKKPLFTIQERMDMIQDVFQDYKRLEVDTFSGLLIDYARHCGANVLVRGLRAVSDFDYEFQMALMNRRLSRSIETVFLMTGLRWIFISSTLIKEVASLGGSVEGVVPDVVARRLREKFKSIQDNG